MNRRKIAGFPNGPFKTARLCVKRLNGIVADIAGAQAADGYLMPPLQLAEPNYRHFSEETTRTCELYSMGHLIEAAVAHYETTGRRELLDGAVKLAEDQPADGHAVVVRVYEPYGRPADVPLQPGWPVHAVASADPLERQGPAQPTSGQGVRLALRGHGIQTVVLS